MCKPNVCGHTSLLMHLCCTFVKFQFSRIEYTSWGLVSNDGILIATFLTVKSFLSWQFSRSSVVQMNRYKRWWLSDLMWRTDAQTAAIIKRLVATGSGEGVRVRYVKAVTLYWGGQAVFTWHNKTLKPQLKGNIWKEGLYVSHRERRARDTHRER